MEQKQSEVYNLLSIQESINAVSKETATTTDNDLPVIAAIRQKRFLWGYDRRSSCPVKDAICRTCEKQHIIRRFVNPNNHKTGHAPV